MQKLGSNARLACSLFFGIVFALFLGGCGSSEPSPTWNIAGSWFMYQATNGTSGEQGPNLFTLTQSTNTISGTTSQGQTITGDISGENITFSWVGSDGATNTYTGKIGSDGSTMSGTWKSTNGQSGTWQGIIDLSASVNISGNWNTTGEQGTDLFTLSQSANTISGTTSEGDKITGNISRLTVLFFWTGSDGNTTTISATAASDGTKMSGTWTSTDGKSGTWTATKGS
jgi:hypothetical protein